MINQATIKKMNELRLTAMAEAFQNQLSDDNYQALTFEERVGLIVDQEWYRRKNNKIIRLIKKADFRYSNACIEDIEYHVDRQLNKEQILRLGTCAYIHDKKNIIISGASGNGKSYISCAFGNAACRNDLNTKCS